MNIKTYDLASLWGITIWKAFQEAWNEFNEEEYDIVEITWNNYAKILIYKTEKVKVEYKEV